MDPHITDWLTWHAQIQASLNWQPTNLNVTCYSTEPFIIFSLVCDKVAKEWRDVFEELEKRGGSF